MWAIEIALVKVSSLSLNRAFLKVSLVQSWNHLPNDLQGKMVKCSIYRPKVRIRSNVRLWLWLGPFTTLENPMEPNIDLKLTLLNIILYLSIYLSIEHCDIGCYRPSFPLGGSSSQLTSAPAISQDVWIHYIYYISSDQVG